jgi:hypothetical protein
MTGASFPQASDGLDRRPLLRMPTPVGNRTRRSGSFEPFSSTLATVYDELLEQTRAASALNIE